MVVGNPTLNARRNVRGFQFSKSKIKISARFIWNQSFLYSKDIGSIRRHYTKGKEKAKTTKVSFHSKMNSVITIK